MQHTTRPVSETPWLGHAVLAAAALLAALSARPYAGAWNDGSRLATVESLVDRGTLAIDDSIFVRVPPLDGRTPSPYPVDDALLQTKGTLDKLQIEGRFYSDKSPVPTLLLAGVYRGWRSVTGLTARERPDLFCLLLTLASSGLAYVVAVGCVDRLGTCLGVSLSRRLALTTSFALCTVALPYTQFVNNHILLLGVTAALTLGLVRLAQGARVGDWRLPAWLGTLTGFGYTIDLGAGPVLLLAAFAVVAWRCRRLGPLLAFGLAALPWLTLHHAVNYATGGTLMPANAVAEYLRWPGSPFDEDNMTGGWKHSGTGRFAVYALSLLLGKRGLLGHNLPLLLLLPAFWHLLRGRLSERPEMVFASVLCGGVWLMYAINSNNHSGQCLSIRWLVPLLAPGYYLLAVLLRDHPRLVGVFVLLSAWGFLIAALGWWYGPWSKISEWWLWPIRAGVVGSGIGYRVWQRTSGHRQGAAAPHPSARLAA